MKSIGVVVKIKSETYADDWAYCSLGEYVSKKNQDTYGINDDDIMYYFKDLQELKENFLHKYTDEFDGTITDYEIVYNKK